jgi:AAHS family 4-hydroxybenzoate transporter-like MFS transporter
MRATIDVQEVIDSSRLSRMQRVLLLLCFLIVAIDGFDTASIGFLAPAIRAAWSLQATQLTYLFMSGLLGLMLGAMAIGPFADRRGRKVALCFSVGVFGAASLISAASVDIRMLIALRFVTGFGLGGAMPNAITLTSEYCPQGRRSSLVTAMFCGFTIGSALGGVVSARLIPEFGWRSVLIAGGVGPLFLLPFALSLLPESLRFLALRGAEQEKILSLLRRIAAERDFRDVTFTEPARANETPVRELFLPEYFTGTLLLWLTFFMSLLVVYLLSNWLPTLMHDAGLSIRRAALITAMLQVGGTVGAVAIGRLMDQFNPYTVLCISYLFAAVSVAFIGKAHTSTGMLVLMVFLAGFFVSGSQVGGGALSAAYYPTTGRATGVSWANGVGRMGSIVGSALGGILLAWKLNLSTVFAVVGIPAAIAGVSMAVMGMTRRTGLER